MMAKYEIRQNLLNDKQFIVFEADELRKDNVEYTYLVEEYNCCYIYDVLEQLYDDFVYILQGVNEFNVNLDGV